MATIKNGWLVYQPEQEHLLAHVQDCAEHQQAALEPVTLADFLANAASYLVEQRHIVAFLESVDLGRLLQCASEHHATVGLLPVHAKSKVCRLFGIAAKIEDAMPLALKQQGGVSLDLLFCNDEVVIWMVILGDVPFIELKKIAYEQGLFWQHIKSIPASIRMLFQLQPKQITVTTAKETKIKTALIGALIIENDIEALVPHFAKETASNLDGKLSVVFVAPTSIMDYLSFFATVLSPRPRLSRAISYLKTARMTLESPVPIDYYIDGQQRSAQHLSFRNVPKAVTVNVGQKFLETHKPSETDKDIVKVKTLPQGKDRLIPLSQRLPLFSTAEEEDFKEIFLALRDYARPSTPFNLFMILSAMLATMGMFLDNAPVVIGAMLLAPLMGPLVALSMATLRNNPKLLRSALLVFCSGTGLALFVAALTTFILPYEQITGEIRSRLQPNLLDLGVAVVSGIAAAYAHARENVQKSLPGVAVAVALVPPICVMGIGIGWMEWDVISGAGLLFVANLVGIVLAGMFTFMMLGFAPVIKVNRELSFSLLLAILVSFPLYQSFKNTIVYERIEKHIGAKTYQVNGKSMELSDIAVRPAGDKLEILAQLHSPEAVQAEDIEALRDILGKQLDKPVLLDVSARLVR